MRTFLAVIGFSLPLAFSVSTHAGASSSSGTDDKVPDSQGEYELRLNGQRIGQEQFRVFKGKNHVIEITHVMYYPEPSRQELRYELESSREPRKLELVATRGGIVTELKLERRGDNWRAEVKGQGRKTKHHELGRRAGSVIDFDSPLFDALTLRSLGLGIGEDRAVDAITLALPDLVAAREAKSYSRVEDEEIETEFAGTLVASVYEQMQNGNSHRLWVGPSGIVLKELYERPGDEEIEIVLKRMKSKQSAWP